MLPIPENAPAKLTVIVFVVEEPVTPGGSVQIYDVAPGEPVVLYVTDDWLQVTEFGPEINAGCAGVERTATVLGGPLPHPFPPNTLTLPETNPAGKVMFTLNTFPGVVRGFPELDPLVITAPAGALHVRKVAPLNGDTVYVYVPPPHTPIFGNATCCGWLVINPYTKREFSLLTPAQLTAYTRTCPLTNDAATFTVIEVVPWPEAKVNPFPITVHT